MFEAKEVWFWCGYFLKQGLCVAVTGPELAI